MSELDLSCALSVKKLPLSTLRNDVDFCQRKDFFKKKETHITESLFLHNRKRLTVLDNELTVEGSGRNVGKGVKDGHAQTAMFKTGKQQGLLYSTWNSAQCYVPVWMEVHFGGE